MAELGHTIECIGCGNLPHCALSRAARRSGASKQAYKHTVGLTFLSYSIVVRDPVFDFARSREPYGSQDSLQGTSQQILGVICTPLRQELVAQIPNSS